MDSLKIWVHIPRTKVFMFKAALGQHFEGNEPKMVRPMTHIVKSKGLSKILIEGEGWIYFSIIFDFLLEGESNDIGSNYFFCSYLSMTSFSHSSCKFFLNFLSFTKNTQYFYASLPPHLTISSLEGLFISYFTLFLGNTLIFMGSSI